jgi:hypothetical protein
MLWSKINSTGTRDDETALLNHTPEGHTLAARLRDKMG